MIRQLAQCPYCNGCEIALNDLPELVFNPEQPPHAPCAHLAWVEGRYSQWEHPDHGLNRVIGSIEFSWAPTGAEALAESLLPYLKELASAGPGWAFAPPTAHAVRTVWGEEKGTDAHGKEYTVWDVDGWAVFAEDRAAFWGALPEGAQRQSQALDMSGNG